MSFLLLSFNLFNWYVGFDTTQLRRFGHLEITWQSPWVIVHHVSQAEETWRQQVENRAIIERWFEGRRSVIDRDIQTLAWGSEPYLAAKKRYNDWWDSHKAYQVLLSPRIAMRSSSPACIVLPSQVECSASGDARPVNE